MASQDITHNPTHQIILPLRWKAISLAELCIAPTVIKSEQALEVSAYANLNIHAEYVEPDKETAQVKKYTGLLDQQGLLNTRLWGISASHKPIGGHFIGIKTEVFDTDNSGGYGGGGDRSTAAFVSYDYGMQTFKAMLADTDNYGEVSYTLGWDYRYSDTVKFFVEYYAEEETSAITAECAGSEVFDMDASGGRAVAAGVSLNFAW